MPLFGGQWDGQTETYYLVRTVPFEPRPHLGTEALAAESVSGLRWWAPGELATAAADGVIFAPRALPGLLEPLRRGVLPPVPIDAGV
jgi:hypothetical protein